MNLRQITLYLPDMLAVTPEDDDQVKLQKGILVLTTIVMSTAGIIWGFLYSLFSEPIVALIPLSYSFFSAVNLIALKFTRNFMNFRFLQLLFTLSLPVLLMAALGGFINGSAVIIWGLLTPIGALLCCHFKQTMYWFTSYILLLILSGILQPYIRQGNNLPQSLILTFFIINLGGVSSLVFFLLNYFVGQKDKFIELNKKNSELEKAYLKQELILHQSEKLVTLGKLSAGLAHELNNPASAAQRGAEQLREVIINLQNANFKLGEMDLTESQLKLIEKIDKQIFEKSLQPLDLDPLKRNDLEAEMETILDNLNIENAWEHSPVLVNLGFDKSDLIELTSNFNNKEFPVIIALFGSSHTALTLLEEIYQGTGRINQIVKVLKSYTFMDQAPIQSIDIHEGLDNTLVMLRSQLKKGINVVREYSDNLPRIMAYGSELNQVWTNLIDNAISAMNGVGKLILRTYKQDEWLVIDIIDNGQGIPLDIQPKIFDPFFTTKAPGEGTGLGLNISFNVITKKHNGDISVSSKPGETCFRIKLPLSDNKAAVKKQKAAEA